MRVLSLNAPTSVSLLTILIGDAFFVFEKEPRSFIDARALIQTIYLDRFKFLNNKFIKKMRDQIYNEIINKKTAKDRIPNVGLEGKKKYISQLSLRPRILPASEIDQPNTFQIECNKEWSMCGFDHTVKNRYATYFQYRKKFTANEWDDEYFSNKPKETSEISKDNLIIERHIHYCDNKAFTEKMNLLLSEGNPYKEAFPNKFLNLPKDKQWMYNKIMKSYVKHIEEYEVFENDISEERKSSIKYTTQRGDNSTSLPRKLLAQGQLENLAKRSYSIWAEDPKVIRRDSTQLFNDYVAKKTTKMKLFERESDIQHSHSSRFLANFVDD